MYIASLAAAYASNALRRFLKVSRLCRCQMLRTPPPETNIPSLSQLIADSGLTKSRVIDGQLTNRFFNVRFYAVFRIGNLF